MQALIKINGQVSVTVTVGIEAFTASSFEEAFEKAFERAYGCKPSQKEITEALYEVRRSLKRPARKRFMRFVGRLSGLLNRIWPRRVRLDP